MQENGGARNGHGRPATAYCIVPRDLAHRLHEPLRAFFRDEPVEVVVELRERERRRRSRRGSPTARAPEEERRSVRSKKGRRIGERRAMVVPVPAPALPPKVRRYAERLEFVERIEPGDEHAEDVDTARLVARWQSSEEEAFNALYLRYFDRIYSYVQTALNDPHEAEDETQQVFTRALVALPRYEIRSDKPFRVWLFHIARNTVIDHLRKHRLIHAEAPERIDERLACEAAEIEPRGLDWLSDSRLVMLIERLPLAQRKVLTLRYFLGFSTPEIATALGRSPVSVRNLEHRALRFLEGRLDARQAARRSRRAPMLIRVKRPPVLRGRKFALTGPSRPLGLLGPGLTYERRYTRLR